MRKILLSDFHETPFREIKFESQKFGLGEWAIQILSGKKKKKRTLELARKFIGEHDIPFFVSNGDLMEAKRTERGWSDPDDASIAKDVRERIEKYLGAPGVFGVGNHELGYELPLTTDPQAGLSKESVRSALEVYGRDSLYHSFAHEGFRFIFLPYLFAEKRAVDFDLDLLKSELMTRLTDDLEKGEPIILFLHDPDSLCYEPLSEMVRNHKSKIRGFFCGHLHASQMVKLFSLLVRVYNSTLFCWFMSIVFILTWIAFDFAVAKKIRAYFIERRKLPSLIKEFGVKVIPAPGGMLGMDGGFLVLNLFEDGTIEIEKH